MQDIVDVSLRSLAINVLFTEARATNNPLAKLLAAPLPALRQELEKADGEHFALRGKVVLADAAAAGSRQEVEDFVWSLSDLLLGLCKQDRKHPLFLTYFAQSASALVKADRAQLLQWLQGVAEPLGKEVDKALAAQGKPADALVKQWQAVLGAQGLAETANAQHGAKVRDPLRAKVNGVRRKLKAELDKLAVDHGKGKRWADSFFPSHRRTKKPVAG